MSATFQRLPPEEVSGGGWPRLKGVGEESPLVFVAAG